MSDSSGQQLVINARESVRELGPAELQAQAGQVLLLDCRESEELSEGMLPGALHVPRSYLETRIESLAPERDQPIVLYCASGVRSALGAWTLQQQMGYRAVAHLRGGIQAWKDAGLPLESRSGLTPEQRQRYSRHLLLPEVGLEGQQRLLESRVLLLGAGGLGSPVALYLAAAGVGTLGIVDGDRVELSNLQRQVIHSTHSVGQLKAASAAQAIRALNPDVQVREYPERFRADNALELLHDYHVVVDGADNFPTRYLLNHASVRLGIPVVSAAILGFEAQLSVFAPDRGPCYRCLFRQPPPAEMAPACGVAGVLGVLPGTVGLLQATETLKLLLGVGDALIGRLLLYDALESSFRELRVRRDPECPICSLPREQLEQLEFPDYDAFCAG